MLDLPIYDNCSIIEEVEVIAIHSTFLASFRNLSSRDGA